MASKPTDGRTSRPNFLVFIVDQMNSFSLAHHGNPDVRTPNLDRLCREGVSFTRAYCSNPHCAPSRATLHTGLTPRQHGLITNGMTLPYSVPTLPQALADAGYRTHSVGKLHLQPISANARDAAGNPVSWECGELWDTGVIRHLPSPFYGYQTSDFVGGHVYYVYGDYINDVEARHPGTRDLYSRDRAYYKTPTGQAWRMPIAPELHYNNWIADRAIAFIDSVKAGESFFLVTSFPDPHHPFAACRPYSEMYDPAVVTLAPTWNEPDDPISFLSRDALPILSDWDEPTLRESIAQTYGMITHVDDNVGRVLDHLHRAGLADNTVVAFTSDHGDYLGAHHLLLKWRYPYEQLVRVPFIWHAPRATSQSCRSDIVSHLDFVPTVLDYAGVPQGVLDRRGKRRSDPPGLPGRSLRRAIDEGAALDECDALVEFDDDYSPGPMCRYRMLIGPQYKLCVYGGSGQGILYDLHEDPHEQRNVWDDPGHAEVKCDLLAALADRLALTDRFGGVRYCSA